MIIDKTDYIEERNSRIVNNSDIFNTKPAFIMQFEPYKHNLWYHTQTK